MKTSMDEAHLPIATKEKTGRHRRHFHAPHQFLPKIVQGWETRVQFLHKCFRRSGFFVDADCHYLKAAGTQLSV